MLCGSPTNSGGDPGDHDIFAVRHRISPKIFRASCRSESQLHGQGKYANVPISILSHIAHNCGPPWPIAVLPFTCARTTSTKMRMCSLLVGNASHERLN